MLSHMTRDHDYDTVQLWGMEVVVAPITAEVWVLLPTKHSFPHSTFEPTLLSVKNLETRILY